MDRPRGTSVRLRLTLSYAGIVMAAGVLLLAVVWLFLLRYVPANAVYSRQGEFFPGRIDLIRAFVPAAAWALVALLVLAIGGGWLLAGRMLAPLRRITDATRLAGRGSLSHRIRLTGRDDEFRELADSFDAMLARLEAQLAEQRRFAANASHELRTPLAITQTMLDVAQHDEQHDTEALLERLRAVNTRAIELTEALLLLSRVEQRSFAREEVDLSLLVEEAFESLLPLAEARGISLVASGVLARTTGSAALLAQLTANLVHNAIVHNLPEGGIVNATTAEGSGWAVLTVENTGEPISPHLIPTLTEPFQRGTARVRSDDAGVGLGLAIVDSIVAAHGGQLTLFAIPEGGLRATVHLPAATA
ncbi:MAG: HAMP domain-containing histidine kinase [Micrococcales bacterium]|nr:HAMP domain-containing histidine kinase [Micrococcales bacterium]OJX67010.1 MAG: two-component sensor histidine kinase [Micrococcales bacterium 72-143]